MVVELLGLTRLSEFIHAQTQGLAAEHAPDKGERVGVAVEYGDDGDPALRGWDQALQVKGETVSGVLHPELAGLLPAPEEQVGTGDRDHVGEDAFASESSAGLQGVDHHHPAGEDVEDVLAGSVPGGGSVIQESISAPQDLAAQVLQPLGSCLPVGWKEILRHRAGGEPQVENPASLAVQQVPQAGQEDPFQFLGEGGFVVDQVGHFHADGGRDQGLVSATLGTQGDSRRSAGENELGFRVGRVGQRIQPASDKGVVDRSEGKQHFPGEFLRQSEHVQQEKQVVFRDAQLDVVSLGGLLPAEHGGHGILAKEIDLLLGAVDPHLVNPSPQVGRNGNVGGSGHHAGRHLRDAAQGGEEGPQGLLGGEVAPVAGPQAGGNRERRGCRRRIGLGISIEELEA